jgi:glycosyltransferase involved in cell wall biosynthesis
LNPEAPEVSASIALIQLARNLAKRGHEVTVAAPLKCDGGERNGVDYRNLDSSTELDTDLKELFRRFDTLIVTDDAAMMTRSLRFRNLKKRILWLQSMESTAPVVSVCELNRSADSILCVSDLQKSRLEKAGISPSKLRVIRYGTDPSVYYSRPVHRDHCRICYNGSSSSMSGVDVLLAAFMIVKQCLPHAVLDIFGETIQATDLIDICLWKGKGVNFHEKVSENRLAEAYSRSSLFVIPTRIEQGTVCGLNSLNAQACACPVLTTACAGAKDTIVDGITGRLLSQDSAEALATAMIQMLLDPLRLRIMGETGRAHVLQSFLWEHMADEFLDLIGNVEANEAKFSLPHLNAPIKLGDPAITSQELELMRSVRFHSKVIS